MLLDDDISNKKELERLQKQHKKWVRIFQAEVLIIQILLLLYILFYG